MSYVVTFTDFVPEPRFDGVSWTQVRVEESQAVDGTYALIDTINVGVDPDPQHPSSRSFTTHNATRVDGWYRITFIDAFGNDQLPTDPVHRSAVGEASFLPTVQEVALNILTRTMDRYGNEIGTFNANTRPTDTQVLGLIEQAATDVADVVGDDLAVEYWDDAKYVIAILTAMKIETSFYSEQLNTNRSPYPQLKDLYTSSLTALAKSVSGGTDTPGSTEPAHRPSSNFPDDSGWMTRVY